MAQLETSILGVYHAARLCKSRKLRMFANAMRTPVLFAPRKCLRSPDQEMDDGYAYYLREVDTNNKQYSLHPLVIVSLALEQPYSGKHGKSQIRLHRWLSLWW